MKKYKFSLSSDSYGVEEYKALKKQFKSKKYTMGQSVSSFEKKLAKWLDVKNAIMVNSGSSANLLLITSLIHRSKNNLNLLKPGDEILVPAVAWSTTIWPIVQLGLVPVFVDINIDTLAIDLKSAKNMISSKTKGMFLIHVLGQACVMKHYVDFCKKNKLILLEDCCESFGAFDEKQSIGTFGHGGSFSHYYSHHLTTIEGGTIITNNNELADDIRSLRAHGWIRDRKDVNKFKQKNNKIDPRFLFLLPGYNVRPTDIQGCIGLEQLKKIDRNLTLRDRNMTKIESIFKKSPDWINIIGGNFIKKNNKKIKKRNRRHTWMNIPILISKDNYSVEKIKKIFEDELIETRPIISGNILKHPAFSKIKYKKDKNMKNSNLVHEKGFMIGCHANLKQEAFSALSQVIKKLNKL
tara:strand:+ start:861 stop:2087 length:1227 start_codon:yes stop_codon:yes gene_type:complete